MVCTMRATSASSTLPPMLVASKPSTQAPMRSMSSRTGCCRLPKKSGSASATRSTGNCRRANQTRIEGGMRSCARMLWNISATTSMAARSPGAVACCFQLLERWRSARASWLISTPPAAVPMADISDCHDASAGACSANACSRLCDAGPGAADARPERPGASSWRSCCTTSWARWRARSRGWAGAAGLAGAIGTCSDGWMVSGLRRNTASSRDSGTPSRS